MNEVSSARALRRATSTRSRLSEPSGEACGGICTDIRHFSARVLTTRGKREAWRLPCPPKTCHHLVPDRGDQSSLSGGRALTSGPRRAARGPRRRSPTSPLRPRLRTFTFVTRRPSGTARTRTSSSAAKDWTPSAPSWTGRHRGRSSKGVPPSTGSHQSARTRRGGRPSRQSSLLWGHSGETGRP